jgi:hypothetical protein
VARVESNSQVIILYSSLVNVFEKSKLIMTLATMASNCVTASSKGIGGHGGVATPWPTLATF